MNFGSLNCFLLFKTNGKAFKTPSTVLGWKPPWGYSARHGGLPHTAGRPAGWVTAWRPGPAKEAHAGHTRGVAGPRAPTNKVSLKWQCEHREDSGNVHDEVAAARAHPSSGSTCGGEVEAAR
jgi:hypothetical protein